MSTATTRDRTPSAAQAPPTLRFAPSPNGALHLGHAYSALLNADIADRLGGRLLLRIEDIDTARCTPALEKAMRDDLAWLGLVFDGPVRRQSECMAAYRDVIDRLAAEALVYPAFRSRAETRAAIEAEEARRRAPWPRDPDGAPLYPTDERGRPNEERARLIAEGRPFAWRLDMDAALARLGASLQWRESGIGPNGETGMVAADPAAFGDVVLARRDTPTSYHLSVVLDDALQQVTHVVRGRDLFHATAVHRLLQELLGLPAPAYHHHDLVLAEDGEKLSKSRGDTALSTLRAKGMTPADIRAMAGLDARVRTC